MNLVKCNKTLKPWLSIIVFLVLFTSVLFISLSDFSKETIGILISIALLVEAASIALNMVANSIEKRAEVFIEVTCIESESYDEEPHIKISFPEDVEFLKNIGVTKFKMEV